MYNSPLATSLSFTITEGVRSDSNRVEITAIGVSGREYIIPALVLRAPGDATETMRFHILNDSTFFAVFCEYSLNNGLVTVSCTGGTGDVARYEYRINEGTTISGGAV